MTFHEQDLVETVYSRRDRHSGCHYCHVFRRHENLPEQDWGHSGHHGALHSSMGFNRRHTFRGFKNTENRTSVIDHS